MTSTSTTQPSQGGPELLRAQIDQVVPSHTFESGRNAHFANAARAFVGMCVDNYELLIGAEAGTPETDRSSEAYLVAIAAALRDCEKGVHYRTGQPVPAVLNMHHPMSWRLFCANAHRVAQLAFGDDFTDSLPDIFAYQVPNSGSGDFDADLARAAELWERVGVKL